MPVYQYRAYNLPILSELEFPEFLPLTSDASLLATTPIRICCGATPAALENPTGQGVLYQLPSVR